MQTARPMMLGVVGDTQLLNVYHMRRAAQTGTRREENR